MIRREMTGLHIKIKKWQIICHFLICKVRITFLNEKYKSIEIKVDEGGLLSFFFTIQFSKN